MRVIIQPTAERAGDWTAAYICRRIRKYQSRLMSPFVIGLPTGSSPIPTYRRLVELNRTRLLPFSNVVSFNMDEYADENGRIAPESWEFGFGHAFKKYFWSQLEPKLRPAEKQIRVFTDKNLSSYGRMLSDLGGADICYSGPGWTGHLAFIEPDAPEFAGSLAEWKKMGPRVCTLSPFTIAQNSLHGCFGSSGDLTAVPPKAATVGPAEVIGAKHRIDMHAITVDGSFASWPVSYTHLTLPTNREV